MRVVGVLVVLAAVAVGGAAWAGDRGRVHMEETAAAPAVQAVPGVSARAFEGRLGAAGWRLSYRQDARGRTGSGRDPVRGLAVAVAERGAAPGLLTGVTCRVAGADGGAALDFLDACLPSDALDPVHHWMVDRWDAVGSGPPLVLGARVFRLRVERDGVGRALSVDAR